MSQAWTGRKQNLAPETELKGFSEGEIWTYLELSDARIKEC